MRKVLITFEPFYGSWPFKAQTEVPGYPATIHNVYGWMSANGPDEEYAIANLKRRVSEWIDPPSVEPASWSKEVEVDW